MGKITFRADDDLVDELEAFDASKSEVMREALRSYIDRKASDGADGSVDDAVRQRVDELLADRLGDRPRTDHKDVHVRISLDADGVNANATGADRDAAGRAEPRLEASGSGRAPSSDVFAESARPCNQCGTSVAADHVYCPNCGEKAAHRVFCECGDEVRSDWSFCPSCGRRTPAADVLDSR